MENHLTDLEEFQSLDNDFLKEKFKEIRSLYNEGLKDLKESQLENNFLQPIFRILGHIFEVQTAKKSEEEDEGTKSIDYAFFYSEEDKAIFQKNDSQKNAVKYSSCSTICETKKWGVLDGYDTVRKHDNTCPIWQLKMSYLDNINPKEQKATVPFGILTDGKSWRIYSYRAETDKFFEINLEYIIAHNDFPAFKMFWFFFSGESFRGISFLNLIESGSKKLQAEVSGELRKQVYLSLELIATGIFRVYQSGKKRDWEEFLKYPTLQRYLDENGLEAIDLENSAIERIVLDIIYSESLVYLFRVLFLLYADHRNLFKHKIVEDKFYTLLNRIDNYTLEIGSVSKDMENIVGQNDDYHINEVFEKIDGEYNGGLFNRKLHPILNNFDIDDDLYANAIDYLTRTFDKKTKKPMRVDFSALEVRHLGTIYEGLLEYRLIRSKEETSIPTLSDKKKKRQLLEDDLYLVNDKGERKATGSYYTPDYIVEYIVKNTVGSLVDEIEKEEISVQQKIGKIFGLRICDPAMGSGHFLVEVINYLNNRISDIIQKEIEPLQKKPGRKSKQLLVCEELLLKGESGYYKQIIGKRCIYGVDKNPMAVELAKLSIWIFTLQKGRKLEFFDYNLRCGDSLIGSQEKTFSAHVESKSKERMLFASDEELYQNVINDFKSEFKKYFEFESVEERIKYYESVILPSQQKLKFLADVELAIDFASKDDKIHLVYLHRKNELLQTIRMDAKNEYLPKLAKGKDTTDWEKMLYAHAKKIQNEYTPIHWELDFPNVFIDKGGFDAVIGNPPYGRYNKLKEILKEFFIQHGIYGKTSDLSEFFIKKGISILNSKAHFSFIVPKGLTYVNSWEDIRNLLINKFFPIEFVDVSQAFTDVLYEMVIFHIKQSQEKAVSIQSGYITQKEFKTFKLSVDLISQNVIYTGLNKKSLKIIEKVKKASKPVSFYMNYWYGKGGMTPFVNKHGEGIKLLTGKEIGRYYFNEDTEVWYLSKNYINEQDINRIYVEKVVVQDIVAHITKPYPHIKITASIDKNARYCLNTVMCYAQKNDDMKNEFLCALINSKFISFYYYHYVYNQAIRTMHFMPGYSDILPIHDNYQQYHTLLSNRADIMLAKNKELQELNNNFWELFRADVMLENIPTKLEKWYLLDWKDFVAELKKKKLELSGKLKDEWFDRFKRKQEEALEIKKVIDRTDAEIDIMVYKLYELTFEEVKIVDPEFGMNKSEYDGYEIPEE
ncbi:MAG: N-6 DNA methylase [Leptospiraceae bacterium]|nr:N-6 DNA methylase [Leptospiraceae bacterium]